MELTTSRLKIREFCAEDFDALYAIDSDPRVCRYETAVLTAEEVRYRLEGALEWARETPRTIYKLALTIPPEKRVCGRLTLKVSLPAIREWEIGWTLHPVVWGKGYASEGARALLDYAFTHLNAHRVVAFCRADNAPSSRVMERLGMQPEGHLRETVRISDAWFDELVYAILERGYTPGNL
jgi:[ribosomal protein S5]-alanine N-acetyltransferase